MTDRRLAILEDLESAEEEVAAELAEIDGLYAAGEEVRLAGLDLVEFHERLPDERNAARREIEETARALEEAKANAERAEQELATAQATDDPERLADARRFHIRAQDALHLAERRAKDAQAHAAELEEAVKAAEERAKDLTARARELAEALRRRPRVALETEIPPDASPADLAEWGTQAHAALLVARNQVASERDAFVRQANELASNVVGEPVAAMSAAGAAELLRRTLEGS
jgi:DNA repair exonuclease SbcCD ATPase subunit